MRIQLFLIIAVSLLVGACGSDPALDGVKLKMKAVSSLSTINGRMNTAGLVFTEVVVGVKEIEFETDLENADEDLNGESDSEEVEFEGPYTVDLINGTSTPSFGLSNAPSGSYDEIEIEMGPVLDDGNTIRIGFTYDSKQVIFSTTEEVELEIENASNYQVDASVLTNLLVLIDLDALFANIDLSTAIADEDGVIRINDSSNSEIAHQIIAYLDESCEAGEDDDHDDDID